MIGASATKAGSLNSGLPVIQEQFGPSACPTCRRSCGLSPVHPYRSRLVFAYLKIGALVAAPELQIGEANPRRRISSTASKPPARTSNDMQKPGHHTGTPGF